MPDPEYFGKLINPLIDKALGLPERDYGRPPSQLERELAQKERSEMAGVKNRAIEDNAKVVNDIRAEARIRGDWGDVPMEKQKQFLMARRALRGDDPMTGGEHPAENVLAPSPAAVALGVGGAADAPRSAQSSGAGPYQTGGRDFGSQGDLSWLQNFTPTEAHALADVMRARAGLMGEERAGREPKESSLEKNLNSINNMIAAAREEGINPDPSLLDTQEQLRNLWTQQMRRDMGLGDMPEGPAASGAGGPMTAAPVTDALRQSDLTDVQTKMRDAIQPTWGEWFTTPAPPREELGGIGRWIRDLSGNEPANQAERQSRTETRMGRLLEALEGNESQAISDDMDTKGSDVFIRNLLSEDKEMARLLRNYKGNDPKILRLLALIKRSERYVAPPTASE